MTAIYKKEIRTYFTHMMGYVFIAFMLLLVGLWFSMMTITGQNPNFHLVLSNITMFFFILVPVLTMRLFSEESRQKTDQLLFTSPLSVTAIVVGKFLAAVTLFVFSVLVTAVFPFMVRGFGSLPLHQIIGAYVGFLLIGMACIAVGVFISVLTDNQIIAAIGTIGAVLVMFIMDFVALSAPAGTFASLMFVCVVILVVAAVFYNSTRNIIISLGLAGAGLAVVGILYFVNNLFFDGIIVRVLLWLSVYSRFNNFAMGILNFNDIIYYFSFGALFIYLTVNVIEKRRWR